MHDGNDLAPTYRGGWYWQAVHNVAARYAGMCENVGLAGNCRQLSESCIMAELLKAVKPSYLAFLVMLKQDPFDAAQEYSYACCGTFSNGK
jgi:hypothetical protein